MGWELLPPEVLGDLSDVDLSTPPTDGQVIKFDDGTSTWVPADDDTGSGLPTASTKGDLAVFDGSDWVILPAGTNTHVLTADSGETEGIKWAAPSGGGSSAAVDVGYATTTLNDAARTLITWTSAPVNDIGGFNIGGAPTIWTAPATKVYEIHYAFYFTQATSSTPSRIFSDVWLNGVPGVGTKITAQGAGGDGASNTDSGQPLFWVASLSANDVLRFYTFFDTVDATRTAAQRVLIRQLS